MNNREMNEVINLIKNLSEKEKESLVGKIMHMLKETPQKNSCNDLVSEYAPERPDCPHCHAEASQGFVIKKGLKNGVQRFYCKKCNKFFVASTNTAFSHTHKDADTWRKFINLTITGATIAECSKACKIAYQTAFTWRHKVLNVFSVEQDTKEINGVVEMDEMLMPISFKGNHVQGNFNEKRRRHEGRINDMPRKSYKRGTDNKSNSAKDKACIFCMIEDGNRSYYGSVPGVGFMTNNMLDATVAKHINKDSSVILVDEYKTTKKYLTDNDYKYFSLLSNTTGNRGEHKPEIKDGYHLQHVNALHHQIRSFLTKYCGVSSKYLNNYISLFMWLKNASAKHVKKEDVHNLSISRAVLSDCYITSAKLNSYPRIPLCA